MNRDKMKSEEYEKMYQLEQTHWFFTCKRKFIFYFLKKFPPKRNSLIFDAGCGTGANHFFLEQFGQVVSLDLSLDALTFCRRREIKRLVRADLNGVIFKSGSFDLIAVLDVLYHSWVKEDRIIIDEFFRILKPGGKLLITDSAFPFLLSRHDQAVMTRERYTLPGLKVKLHAVGFQIRRASYMFFTTFPALAAVRFLEKFSTSKDAVSSNVFPIPHWINKIIFKIMSLEAVLLSFITFPFGSSVIILAEKPIE